MARPNPRRKGPRNRRQRKPGLYLHDCLACDNKWAAPFEVKHCFKCGADERKEEKPIGIIKRRFVPTVKCSDGKIRLKLHLARRPEESDNAKEEA